MFRMIKRLGAYAFVFLFASASFASVTISGNLKDLTGTAVASRTFVRFTIRGCNGNQPRKAGTAIIVPSIYEFTPNASGVISGTLYDSLTDIECGGVVGATWYGVSIFRDGKQNPEVPYNVTGASFNLNSALPNSTNPVVAAPTGDSTYARLDGANQPFTGSITAPSFTGSLTGNASTATALAANGTNCLAGNYPLGVDASGNAENCTAASAGSGTVTSITASSPLTGGTISTTGSIGISDAAADGATKGAATFTAADFNSSAGLISLDYTNGQASDGSHKGFLTSGDWTAFNSKQAAIAGNTLSAHNFANSINSAGTISGAQPAAADLSDGTTGSGTVVESVSPALTGTPTAPTATAGTSTTQIATTAFVTAATPNAFAWGGDGSDSSATADGVATLTCLGAPASSVYTMTRDCFFTTLTVNQLNGGVGIQIKTNNFGLFVSGTLTNAGTIQNNGATGANGSSGISSAGASGGGATAAAGASTQARYPRFVTSIAGTNGGAGGTAAGTQAGAANAGNNSGVAVDSSGSSGATGNAGGVGGTGPSGAGGAARSGAAGGTVTAVAGPSGHNAFAAVQGFTISSVPSLQAYTSQNGGNGGAPGGSGGGGDTTNAGGGGGGGGGEGGSGGMIGIFAKVISNTGIISANGGTGGTGGNGFTPTLGNTGGGGGGAGGSGGKGGIIWLVYQSLTNSGTIQAAGGGVGTHGTKGSPHGSGTDNAANGSDGPSGPAGIVIQIQN